MVQPPWLVVYLVVE